MADRSEARGRAAGDAAGAPVRKAGRPEPVVLREFPQVGKYRVRVVASSAGPRAGVVLDVREYAKSEAFEGFTRRGIRVTSLAEAAQLLEVLRVVGEERLLKQGESPPVHARPESSGGFSARSRIS